MNEDIPSQIRKYAILRDEGFITEEEFEAKKASLLNNTTVSVVEPAIFSQSIAYPSYEPQKPVIQSNKPIYVSGLTTGQNIGWFIASIFTVGLAIPFWWWKAKMSRRRIS